mmetsp:Transcript_41581/g.74608  ORF Transcript_41581/g.74608 Transcript_41581/m.74608 type:complete len:227 (+) Transcript_41581:626-1306(+)
MTPPGHQKAGRLQLIYYERDFFCFHVRPGMELLGIHHTSAESRQEQACGWRKGGNRCNSSGPDHGLCDHVDVVLPVTLRDGPGVPMVSLERVDHVAQNGGVLVTIVVNTPVEYASAQVGQDIRHKHDGGTDGHIRASVHSGKSFGQQDQHKEGMAIAEQLVGGGRLEGLGITKLLSNGGKLLLIPESDGTGLLLTRALEPRLQLLVHALLVNNNRHDQGGLPESTC